MDRKIIEIDRKKQYIMGIVNVTPDSFSDGGKYFRCEDAVRQAVLLEKQGADFIDIGAVSTRPGSVPATQEEELKRLMPVLEQLKTKIRIPISVDTFRPQVAGYALENGASLINDVSGFSDEMAKVIGRYDAWWIAVHSARDGAGAQTVYPDGVICAVQRFFDDFQRRAGENGVDTAHIILDPGFGFGKDVRQNLTLLRHLDELRTHDRPLLAGLSRKRFIGSASSEENPEDRDAATLAADLLAMRKGACIFRVHNVKMHKQAMCFLETVKECQNEYCSD